MFDDSNVVLHCEQIEKIYPGTKALDHVSFDVLRGMQSTAAACAAHMGTATKRSWPAISPGTLRRLIRLRARYALRQSAAVSSTCAGRGSGEGREPNSVFSLRSIFPMFRLLSQGSFKRLERRAQTGLHRPERLVDYLGDLPELQVVHIAELDDLALLGGQRGEQLRQAELGLNAAQNPALCTPPALLARAVRCDATGRCRYLPRSCKDRL